MAALDRRRFASMIAMLGLVSNRSTFAENSAGNPELLHLSQNGWMPNNGRLPVLIYRSAIDARAKEPAATFERVFRGNGWPPQWRNGVYDFHHYHSTAHEVLGFASGSARLMLGGEHGHAITVTAGDVVILPAGTGHCKLSASPDFLVVGAYPPGQTWDICRAAPTPAQVDRMRQLPFPDSDPISGTDGALVRKWQEA